MMTSAIIMMMEMKCDDDKRDNYDDGRQNSIITMDYNNYDDESETR
jgi:hypothetical protein